MEFSSEESQIIERAFKDLLDHWDKEDRKQIGQQFEKRFQLDCVSRWTFQIEKRLGRRLTPEEKALLNYYYLLTCRLDYVLELRDFRGLEERIHQLQEELQDLEEIRQSHLDLRRLTNRFDN